MKSAICTRRQHFTFRMRACSVQLLVLAAGFLLGRQVPSLEANLQRPARPSNLTPGNSTQLPGSISNLERATLAALTTGACPVTVVTLDALRKVHNWGDFMYRSEVRQVIELEPALFFSWLSKNGAWEAEELLQTGFSCCSCWPEKLFSNWEKADPEAALAAACSLPVTAFRKYAFQGLFSTAMERDASRAAHILQTCEQSVFPQGARELMWRSVSFDTGLEIIAKLPAECPLRATLLADVCVNCDPDEFGDLAAYWNGLGLERRRELVSHGMFLRGDLEGPDGALVHLEGMERLAREEVESGRNPHAMTAFLSTAGAQWAQRDLPAALAWLDIHARGVDRAEGIELFFHAAAKVNFAAAIEQWHHLRSLTISVRVLSRLITDFSDEHRAELLPLIETLPVETASQWGYFLNQP